MTIKLSVPRVENELKPRITVIGVGGAGGNAVNNMIRSSLEGVEFVVTNTDAQALAQSQAERKVQLGVGITKGLGAGARPEVGQRAAEEAMGEILDHIQGSNMVFITAGMGGGTGTGAAPVIARAARENGILTVGVVTKPFHFEGTHRMRIAERGIEELQSFVDTLIIIPNQNLFRVATEKTTFAEAFQLADDVLYSGVRGVTDLMMMPGLINLDFADIRSVMSEMGKAMMGTGEADGEKRAIKAAEAAISNPLLDDVTMRGAKGVLINITGGPDMTLYEVDEAANRIREEVDADANIIFGATLDETLDGRIRISMVATGIEAGIAAMPRPQIKVVSDRAGMIVRSEPRLTATPGRPAFATAAAAQFAPTPHPTASAAAALAAELAPIVGAAPLAQPRSAAPSAVPRAEAAKARPVEDDEDGAIRRLIEAANLATPSASPARTLTRPPAPVAARAAAPAAAAAAERKAVAEDPFIAPAPVEADEAPARMQGRSDPFAEAAMANATRPAPAKEKEKVRGNLFGLVTGLGSKLRPAKPPAPAQAARPEAQSRMGAANPADRPALSRGDEDLLDIPAFLRRQAN